MAEMASRLVEDITDNIRKPRSWDFFEFFVIFKFNRKDYMASLWIEKILLPLNPLWMDSKMHAGQAECTAVDTLQILLVNFSPRGDRRLF